MEETPPPKPITVFKRKRKTEGDNINNYSNNNI